MLIIYAEMNSQQCVAAMLTCFISIGFVGGGNALRVALASTLTLRQSLALKLDSGAQSISDIEVLILAN
jgi:hypothetical protein